MYFLIFNLFIFIILVHNYIIIQNKKMKKASSPLYYSFSTVYSITFDTGWDAMGLTLVTF